MLSKRWDSDTLLLYHQVVRRDMLCDMGEFPSSNDAINVLVRNYDTFSSMYCFSSDTPLNYQAMNELYVPSPIMPTCRKPCGGPGLGAGNNSGTVMAGKATTQISPIFRDRALAELIKVPDMFRRVSYDVSPTANWWPYLVIIPHRSKDR